MELHSPSGMFASDRCWVLEPSNIKLTNWFSLCPRSNWTWCCAAHSLPDHLSAATHEHVCFWRQQKCERRFHFAIIFSPEIFPDILAAFAHSTNEKKHRHTKQLDTEPKCIHFNFSLFSPPTTSESQDFKAPFLIDLPKTLPPPPPPETPLGTKGFLFCNNTRVISQVFFAPLLPTLHPKWKRKRVTSNPEQIKMTFEPFLLYFFSWAEFFGEAVIRGPGPGAASRLLTNRCWTSFVPSTLISPACQGLQKEV